MWYKEMNILASWEQLYHEALDNFFGANMGEEFSQDLFDDNHDKLKLAEDYMHHGTEEFGVIFH